MKTIYLSGAIDWVDPEFATSWRQRAADRLRGKYETIDPTNYKDIGLPHGNIEELEPHELVEAELIAIKKSDIVLAEISRNNIPYHGTSIEIAYAHQWGKEVYVWGGNIRSYWIKYHTTKQFASLIGALDYLRKLE